MLAEAVDISILRPTLEVLQLHELLLSFGTSICREPYGYPF